MPRSAVRFLHTAVVGTGTTTRRARSAAHYLAGRGDVGRLRKTVDLAARAVDLPAAAVNILDDDHQYTITLPGDDGFPALPRSAAFCDVVVRERRPLVVGDATADHRFSQLPLVSQGDVGCYVGVPLLGREALVVGTLCAFAPYPVAIGDDAVGRLLEFGPIVEDQLDVIRRVNDESRDGPAGATEVADAIRSGRIEPWYQPIVDLRDGRTRGYEALARWRRSSGVVVPPEKFLPTAEDSDLIQELDQQVLRAALRQLRSLRRADSAVRMSVNVSARHFSDPDSVHELLETIDAAVDLAEAIDVELTETVRIDPGRGRAALHQLREFGCAIWLDDFCTGWSSMDQVLQLPVDGVKIDRSVTQAIGTPGGRAITRAVTGLARDLGLRTVIEGVETTGQAGVARTLGCTLAQGHLFGRPAPRPE